MKKILAAFASTALCASTAFAQSASTAPQLNITTEAALDMAHYAVGLAESRHLKLCVAIEDTDGNLVAFIRMQGAYAGCVEASIAKAKSAARFARNTMEFLKQRVHKIFLLVLFLAFCHLLAVRSLNRAIL